MGDFVIILNAEKVKLQVKKNLQKIQAVFRLSKWTENYFLPADARKKTKQIIYHSVKGMLPKNKLRDRMLKRLKIYTGNTHNHQAQQPEEIKIS